MDKLITPQNMIEQLEDGMTIGIGGWGPRRKPMGLVREILRSSLQDLTVVSYGGADVGLLCASGKVKKLVFAFVSLDFIPLEPFFRQAREKGNLEVMEIDEGMMMLGLQAASMGAPFIPTNVGLGTDVIKTNENLKVITSPYDEKEWVAMPALTLDASFIHVNKADKRGVCQITSPDHYMDDLFARAAKKTFVSCEEVVETSHFHDPDEARKVFWERSVTTGVLHLPGGAHPSSCNPIYGHDSDHLKEYCGYAKQPEGYQTYYNLYLSGPSEEEYIRNVGGLDKVQTLPQTQY